MWVPHLTVAVIIEKDGRYLMVEEEDNGIRVVNQPAGHVEDGESILEAAIRETLEETCIEVHLNSCLGISRFIAPNGSTYFRHSFVGKFVRTRNDLTRDSDILDVRWMNKMELSANPLKLRSPMVMHDIERYESGNHFPLSLYSEP